MSKKTVTAKRVNHNHDVCIKTALDQASKICMEQGLRLTELRKRVLELVWAAHKPIGAYTVLGQLAEDGRSAAPPTVYRALDFLLEQGFVHRIASLNAYIGCDEPGHAEFGQFLICSGCGDVVELQDAGIEKAIQKGAESQGFTVRGEVIEIVGLCPRCSKKSTKK